MNTTTSRIDAPRRCGFCHNPMVSADVYPEPVHPCCELDYRTITEPMYRRTIRRRLAATRTVGGHD